MKSFMEEFDEYKRKLEGMTPAERAAYKKQALGERSGQVTKRVGVAKLNRAQRRAIEAAKKGKR